MFLFSRRSRPFLWSAQSSVQWVPGCESDLCRNAEIRNVWLCIPLVQTTSRHAQGQLYLHLCLYRLQSKPIPTPLLTYGSALRRVESREDRTERSSPFTLDAATFKDLLSTNSMEVLWTSQQHSVLFFFFFFFSSCLFIYSSFSLIFSFCLFYIEQPFKKHSKVRVFVLNTRVPIQMDVKEYSFFISRQKICLDAEVYSPLMKKCV